MADTEYADAWAEEDAPAQNAVMAAAKKASASDRDEYITAYVDLEDGRSINAEDAKPKRPSSRERDEEKAE